MAVTLDNNLGSEVANSYVDIAYAVDYWANHFDSVKSAQWAALTANQQTYLLVRGCAVLETARYTYLNTLPQYSLHYDRRTGKVLDMNLTRDPVKYYYYQQLQFPRNLDVHYLEAQNGEDYQVGDIYIPEPVMIAQCEQSMFLLNFDESAYANRMQGVILEKVSIGRGQIESTQEYSTKGSMFAPVALEMLKPYMLFGAKLRRG